MFNDVAESVFGKAQQEFAVLFQDTLHDLLHWFGRLSDIERLVGLCAFILVLFTLVLVKASTRTSRPGKTRNFLGALVLVVAFSFVAGLLFDSQYDPRRLLPASVS